MKATETVYKRTSFANSPLLKLWTAVSALLVGISSAHSQEVGEFRLISESEELVLRHLPHWSFTTKAYQEEALKLMLEEANKVAHELKLPEQLPITRSNLIEIHIGPPALVALGFVTTSNYSYNVGWGRSFSGLTRWNHGGTFEPVKKAYTWPISRLDTNRAFQVATQILTAVGMDVTALTRDCTIEISAPKPEASGGTHFIPDYWVNWKKDGKLVAFIEFVEPTRSIRQLKVADPKYILRERIKIPNLAQLLSQTNAPATTNGFR